VIITLGGLYYENKTTQQGLEFQLKAEQDKKEYIAKRKRDCLDIYEIESDKWNNTVSWQYHYEADSWTFLYQSDTCEIIYKDDKDERFSRYF